MQPVVIMNYVLILLLALVSGSCWSQEEISPVAAPPPVSPPPAEPPVPRQGPYQVVDEYAEFPGGMAALRKYLSENLVYPPTAIEKELEGKCYIRFVITAKGKITDISIARKVPNCPECDQEAIRLVAGMPDWKPGKVNGKPVDSIYNLPIMFALQ
jgi:protein TonB